MAFWEIWRHQNFILRLTDLYRSLHSAINSQQKWISAYHIFDRQIIALCTHSSISGGKNRHVFNCVYTIICLCSVMIFRKILVSVIVYLSKSQISKWKIKPSFVAFWEYLSFTTVTVKALFSVVHTNNNIAFCWALGASQ